ncbi:hypothetical protein QKW60_19375 [Defluviimonas aestuarii]|uniref:hypothetical protein n=1 Tax=Albidovulum aestuarii TaxID=1130726 RepID=UPI00249C2D66|nr:hypothetical protein [Defluviimonas aestuarii]MDI3338578.1 hypothetical protein [Defluviimonas aestuarii]
MAAIPEPIRFENAGRRPLNAARFDLQLAAMVSSTHHRCHHRHRHHRRRLRSWATGPVPQVA